MIIGCFTLRLDASCRKMVFVCGSCRRQTIENRNYFLVVKVPMCQTMFSFFVIKTTHFCMFFLFSFRAHTRAHTAQLSVVGAPEEETLRRTRNLWVSAHFLFHLFDSLAFFIPFFTVCLEVTSRIEIHSPPPLLQSPQVVLVYKKHSIFFNKKKVYTFFCYDLGGNFFFFFVCKKINHFNP